MNLQEWLGQQHSLPEQLAVIEGLCAATNEAHQRSVLHRALEPANIEVLADGRCSLQAAVRSEAATPGAAARYRAPEILEGAPYSPKADIYSVGAICYEMLSGRPPSGSERPRPLSELRADVSRDLTDAVMGCLERGPDWRPGDLSYMLQVVAQLRGSTRARPAKAPEPPRAAAPTPRKVAARGPSSRSNVPLVAVVLVLAAGGGVGAWLWLQSQGEGAAIPRVAAPPPRPVPTVESPSAATPGPEVVATPTPRPAPPLPSTSQPEREALSKPNPPVTPLPTPRPAPETPPTGTRAATSLGTPPPAPPAAEPAEPAVLTALSPLALKRPTTAILDLRGIGLRPEHQARVLKIKNEPNGITIVRQKYVGPSLLQVVVKLDENVALGTYGMGVLDSRGTWSNNLSFTVTR